MDFAFLGWVVGEPDCASAITSGAPQVALAGEDQYVSAGGRELVEAFFGCRRHHSQSAHSCDQRPE
jgi:hypothetical protein